MTVYDEHVDKPVNSSVRHVDVDVAEIVLDRGCGTPGIGARTNWVDEKITRRTRRPRARRRLFLIIPICCALPLVVLPLGWKEQATLGVVFMVGAALLSRASRSTTVTLMLMAVSFFSTLRYGYWRVTQTWDGITSAGHLYEWDTVFVLLLLAAELYAFVTLALGYFQTLRPLHRRAAPLSGNPRDWPTVDVLIPTYNEPLNVVRATVLGALALDYPADKLSVIVLDDGQREEFSEFAHTVGAGYITRHGNAHAKAGNINHALELTQGELVAIFDSDHIPTRSFLKMTVGWFVRDERLGLVQTPHHFYSPDPFERNLKQFRKIPNEGDLFHRLIQDGNDLWNASFFCGSCAVLRRRALEQIGGIAVETVTEDAHTALRLQRLAWNTAYINVPLAAGLATESLAAHIGQRIRWARGMVQILRLENPLFRTGLSPAQRLCYLNATIHFLFAVPRLIFLTMPLVYLLFGMVNIYGYSLAVFAYAFPHIVLANVTNSRIQGRYRFSFWAEIYEAVLAPYILVPTLLALINPRLGKFNVTTKGGTVVRSYFDHRIALPFICLLALNIAGLVMAERRYVTDPAHHDTIAMNSLWTVYNIVILSVAASVAFERRQRRSEVRVDVRVPVTLMTMHGRKIGGVTAHLSRHGAAALLEEDVPLERGAPVLLMLRQGESEFEIPARVASSIGREQHVLFPRLELWQERHLVNLVYSQADAWVACDASRPTDRPLRSLGRILWLALRGLVVVSWASVVPVRSPRRTTQRSEGERSPVAAALILAIVLCTPGTAEASATSFQDELTFRAMGLESVIRLGGEHVSQSLTFEVPFTKIISGAKLQLRYSAPLIEGNQARLVVRLNEMVLDAVRLEPGLDRRVEVQLPADLLTTNNALALRVEGNCARCENARAPWISVSPDSSVEVSGIRLVLANDLSMLPRPFFDPATERAWSLPVVFGSRPDARAAEAAAAVSSWFGVLSDYRGVRFPVAIGQLPPGNAVVIALRSSELAARLSLPSVKGPLLAVRENPNDPFGKLLIVAGDEPADLLKAARALVQDNKYRVRSDAAQVADVKVQPRYPYDAPRWLSTDRPTEIGTYTSDERLRQRGSGSINIYLRIPPDLILAARPSVPLILKFTYGGVARPSHARMHVRLNGEDIDAIRLAPSEVPATRAVVVRLPTGRLRAYTNTLTLDVDFGTEAAPAGMSPFAAVHRDSSIDLRALPHSVLLPRLELLADAGYPFTQWADLGRTAVVLSDAPTRAELEALLDMVGFFGAQTGWPATAITVTDAAHIEDVRDRDLVVLGAVGSQPLLSKWSGTMPFDLTSRAVSAGARPASRWTHPQWPFRPDDYERLGRVAANGASLDLVVQDFVSPLRPDRSVVTIVPRDPDNSEDMAALFTPRLRQGPVYGGVSVDENGRFESFLVGSEAYRSGRLDSFQRAEVFLLENYWLVPIFVAACAFAVSTSVRRATERIAARRLEPAPVRATSFGGL